MLQRTDENLLFHELIEKIASENPNKTAMIYMGKRYTYKKFLDNLRRFASALIRLGLKENDKVGLYLPNTPQSLIAFHGISMAGGTAVLLSAMYSAGELAYIIEENKIRIVICTDINIGNIMRVERDVNLEKIIVTRLDDELPMVKRLVARGFDRIPKGHIPKNPKIYPYRELMSSKVFSIPQYASNWKQRVQFIAYTGGTTGTPKGVPHTHYEIISGFKSLNEFYSLYFKEMKEGKEIWAGYQPFYHLAGQIFLNIPLFRGETLVIFPFPDIDAILSGLGKQRISVVAGTPTFYIMILGNQRLNQYLTALKGVKYFTSGADALPADVFKRWKELVGKELLQTWGATETFLPAHNIPGEADLSLGSVLPGYEVAIMDLEENKFLDDGGSGELVVRSNTVLKEYINKPEETNNVLVKVNGKIWYRTGDLGKIEKGKIYFEDRKREIIKYKGYNVGASEVEQALYSHPGVKEVAVIGVPDRNAGEIIKAVVVLHDDAKNVTFHDLMEICREKIAHYKIPKHIEFRDALPKSAHTGKILKRELREQELLKRGRKE